VLLSSAQSSADYQFQWDGTLPAFDIPGTSAPVFFGGFFEDEDPSILTGYAEYTPPGATTSQSVVVLAQFDANGLGQVIEVLDAEAFDNNMGPRGTVVQPGGILKPVYYLEQRSGNDPEQWVGESFPSSATVTVPPSGMAGLRLHRQTVPTGTYSLEVEVVDFYLNSSDPLVFPVTVAPTLQIASLPNGALQVTWPNAASGFVLQSTTNLGDRAWSNVPTNNITTGEFNSLLIQPSTTGNQSYFRLQKISQ
jgi:hypothetical protein